MNCKFEKGIVNYVNERIFQIIYAQLKIKLKAMSVFFFVVFLEIIFYTGKKNRGSGEIFNFKSVHGS
jgi:hypothetical protein